MRPHFSIYEFFLSIEETSGQDGYSGLGGKGAWESKTHNFLCLIVEPRDKYLLYGRKPKVYPARTSVVHIFFFTFFRHVSFDVMKRGFLVILQKFFCVLTKKKIFLLLQSDPFKAILV